MRNFLSRQCAACFCDGLSRRAFLQMVGLVLGLLLLSEDVRGQEERVARGFVSRYKASNLITENEYKERGRAIVEKLGRAPFPLGYKVAFADKNPLRSQILKTQHPVFGREAIELVRRHPGIMIVDLRTPREFADEHIPGAINVPFVQGYYGFVRSLAKLDATRMTLIHCDMGKNASKARLGFGAFGFKDIYTMRDGLRGWLAADGKTVGPKERRANPLDGIPPLAIPRLTPRANSATKVSDGPFATIPVSNDFAFATDFAFDGHGNVTSAIITFLIRKRADVVGKPFRHIPDFRYPREHVKNWNGIRLFHGDAGGREHIRFRADGTLLRPKFPSRGNPSTIRFISPAHAEEKLSAADRRKLRATENQWDGHGALGIHTDVFNNIWFGGYKGWTREGKASSLNLITGGNRHIVLARGGEIKTPYSLVHDAKRSLLFYVEPFRREVWVLPVDRKGGNIGRPRKILEMGNAEPWALALDEFGNLYVSADPNIWRYKIDETGRVMGTGMRLNKQPIERAHAIHFGHGAGFSETSLYVISTPRSWRIVADPLTGYVTGTFRADGSVSRQLENVRGFMSEFVRLDLGVRGAPETLVKVEKLGPDNYPDGMIENIEDKQKKSAF